MNSDHILRDVTAAAADLLNDDVVVAAILTSDADHAHERVEAARSAVQKAVAHRAKRSRGLLSGPRRAITRALGAQ